MLTYLKAKVAKRKCEVLLRVLQEKKETVVQCSYCSPYISHLHGEDKAFVLYYEETSGKMQVYPAEKMEKGYRVMSPYHENYILTNDDLFAFGYTQPFFLFEANGRVDIQFPNEEMKDAFVKSVGKIDNWRGTHRYYKSKEEAK